LSSRLFSFFVISTERSEWRDLINAPLAQAASRRDISTTLDMTGGGDVLDKPSGKAERSTTLDMTGGEDTLKTEKVKKSIFLI
jgi:hypothetical protein